jgi:hypothetical protein
MYADAGLGGTVERHRRAGAPTSPNHARGCPSAGGAFDFGQEFLRGEPEPEGLKKLCPEAGTPGLDPADEVSQA